MAKAKPLSAAQKRQIATAVRAGKMSAAKAKLLTKQAQQRADAQAKKDRAAASKASAAVLFIDKKTREALGE